MTKLAFVIAAALVAPAAADDAPAKLAGDEAKGLIRALSLANLKSAKQGTAVTWSIKKLGCTTKEGEVWDLPTTLCEADAKKITGASAVLLEEAMNAAKIPAPYMMGKKQIRAAAVTCVQDTRAKDGLPFQCTYTPVGRGE